MKAVILAGGKGTRLGGLTARVPKPLLPIGDRSVLEHQIALLRRYGITQVLIVTGHLSGRIEAHLRSLGVAIDFVREDEPHGTAGALAAAAAQLGDDFLLLYGDIMLDVHLPALLAFHRCAGSRATLVVHSNDHPADSDLVALDPDTAVVSGFHLKPHPPGSWFRNLACAGVYVLSPAIFEYITPAAHADLGRDVIPRLLGREPLYGYTTGEYLKDMGTPSRLRQVREDYAAGRIARRNGSRRRPAVFLDRDGVLNRYVGLVHRPEDLELLPGVAEGVRALNEADVLAVLVTNQPVVARGLCSRDELETIHGKLEMQLAAAGARLDAIYCCPHHPDGGYPGENPRYKVACNCRKPGTGMIERAAADLNIALEASLLVGDSARDVRCGRRAGLRTVRLTTGEAWDGTGPEADRVCGTFREAIDFALGRG